MGYLHSMYDPQTLNVLTPEWEDEDCDCEEDMWEWDELINI